MSEWIEWEGGEQPVPDGRKVEVIFADMDEIHDTDVAQRFRWEHQNSPVDIVSYRVINDAHDFVEQSDPVNHPTHYANGGIECIEVLEQLAAQGHDFRVLNAIKYCWRYPSKGGAEILRKAIWYLDRKASELEREERE